MLLAIISDAHCIIYFNMKITATNKDCYLTKKKQTVSIQKIVTDLNILTNSLCELQI